MKALRSLINFSQLFDLIIVFINEAISGEDSRTMKVNMRMKHQLINTTIFTTQTMIDSGTIKVNFVSQKYINALNFVPLAR